MQRKISFTLILLYLLPWGIQCLVNNFISVYVISLPFATEKTVGEVAAVGALVTVLSQFIWTRMADKTLYRGRVLAISLILLTIASLLFCLDNHSKILLFVFVIFFYSCYMVHQPLVDTIASENHQKTKHSFGWFRSFASLGYAVMGLLFTVLPNENPSIFFIYVAVLAGISVVVAWQVPPLKPVSKEQAEQKETDCKQRKGVFNKRFVLFLVYTFFLFMGSSFLSTFQSVYFTAKDGLGGTIGQFSLLVTIGTFIEWAIMMVFGKAAVSMKPKNTFMLIGIAGVLRSGVIYFLDDYQHTWIAFLFMGMWFGLLWAAATPYIKKIVPEESLATAQGIWTVTASGIAPFVVSLLGGNLVEQIGLKNLFGVNAVMLALLVAVTPILIKEHAEQ